MQLQQGPKCMNGMIHICHRLEPPYQYSQHGSHLPQVRTTLRAVFSYAISDLSIQTRHVAKTNRLSLFPAIINRIIHFLIQLWLPSCCYSLATSHHCRPIKFHITSLSINHVPHNERQHVMQWYHTVCKEVVKKNKLVQVRLKVFFKIHKASNCGSEFNHMHVEITGI